MSSCQAWIWLWDKSVPQSSVRAEQVGDVLEMFGGFGDLSSWSRQSGFLLYQAASGIRLAVGIPGLLPVLPWEGPYLHPIVNLITNTF